MITFIQIFNNFLTWEHCSRYTGWPHCNYVFLLFFTLSVVGGAMASSLVHLSLVRTLCCVLGQDTLLSQCLSTGPLGSYAEVAFTWSVVIIDFVTLSWVWKVLSGSGSWRNYGAGFPRFNISWQDLTSKIWVQDVGCSFFNASVKYRLIQETQFNKNL